MDTHVLEETQQAQENHLVPRTSTSTMGCLNRSLHSKRFCQTEWFSTTFLRNFSPSYFPITYCLETTDLQITQWVTCFVDNILVNELHLQCIATLNVSTPPPKGPMYFFMLCYSFFGLSVGESIKNRRYLFYFHVLSKPHLGS